MRKTIDDILKMKKNAEKIIMLTAYDFPMASIIDRANVDIILVGDSLANVVLGLERTKEVGMAEMLHHAKAVNRAVEAALLVGDMPYEAYQENMKNAVANAKRFIDEAGCQAVKIEWFEEAAKLAREIVDAGIPVMGHVGLTPQTVDKLGGFKVQGKDAAAGAKILENARALEAAGCFSIVLECIPAPLARIITQKLKVPTIGIGAGVDCDGQVLVTHDLLKFGDQFQPKFTKQYADLGAMMQKAIESFCGEVKAGKFPDEKHSYQIKDDELKLLNKHLK